MPSRLKHSLAYLLLAYTMAFGGHALLAVAPWQAWPVLWLLTGSGMWGLWTMGHDCLHRAFADDTHTNDICGMLAFLPVCFPFYATRHLHLQHHRHLSEIGMDNAWSPMTVGEYENQTATMRVVYRLIRGFGFFLVPILFLLTQHFSPVNSGKPKQKVELINRWLCIAYGIAVAVICVTTLGWTGWLVVWIAPYLVFSGIFATLTLAQHTGEAGDAAVPWNVERGKGVSQPLEHTVDFDVHPVVAFLLWNGHLHSPHHVNPRVPFFQLPAARKQLPAGSIRTNPSLVTHMWDIVRNKHLYIPERNQWISFPRRSPTSLLAKKSIRVALIVLSLIYFSQPAQSDTAVPTHVECKLYRTIDKEMPVASLMAQEKVFVPIDCKSATFGFSSDVFWIKVTVTPGENLTEKLDMEIGYPPLDNIEFYNERGELVRKTGDSLPFASRDYRNRNYIFPLDAKTDGSQIVAWLRIASEGSIQVPITVYTQKSLTEKTTEEYLGFGLYYGIIFAMIIYNSFLFLIVRERAYFFYVLYISCYGLFQLSLNGLGYMYIWPNLTNWNNYSIPILITAMFFFVFLFSKKFLETAAFAPSVDKILTGLTIASALLGIASLTMPLRWSIMGVVLFSFIAASAVWMAGWRTFRAGYEPSRYFLIAWSSFLAGIILISLKNFGVVPSFFLTDYGMQIGSAAEVMMLSFGLGYRIKQMELMKAAAERESSISERNSAEYKLIARMTQMLAHDVRKPFSSLKTAIRLLLSASDGNQARSLALKYLPELDRQLQSVDAMIQDVMQVGAEQKLTCETVNISELIRASLNDSVSSLDDRNVLITYDTLVESYVKGSEELKNWVEIKYFTDPQDAINFNSSHLDLSILDVDYGTRLNGFDIARSIRQQSGHTKICIHSNLGILDLQREVAKANIDLYLPKPMSRGQFLAMLQAAAT